MSAPGHMAVIPPSTRVLSDSELRVLLKEAARQGANEALKSLGLDDEYAPRDMREMREWLSAWRVARNQAWKTVVGTIIKGLLVIFFLGLAIKFGWKLPDWMTR